MGGQNQAPQVAAHKSYVMEELWRKSSDALQASHKQRALQASGTQARYVHRVEMRRQQMLGGCTVYIHLA